MKREIRHRLNPYQNSGRMYLVKNRRWHQRRQRRDGMWRGGMAYASSASRVRAKTWHSAPGSKQAKT